MLENRQLVCCEAVKAVDGGAKVADDQPLQQQQPVVLEDAHTEQLELTVRETADGAGNSNRSWLFGPCC